MTKPLREAVEIVIKTLPKAKKVLEIGSKQEKNQNEVANLRGLFSDSSFIGVDMRPGSGVDVVANAQKLPFKNGAFDLVLCLETLEHCDHPWLVTAEIERVLGKSGVAIVSSQQNFPIHMHHSDYFRYTPSGLRVLFNKLKSVVFSISPPYDDEVKLNPQHVVLIGGKSDNEELFKKVKRQLRNNTGKISGHKPYRHRLQDAWKFFKRGVAEAKFRWEIEFF